MVSVGGLTFNIANCLSALVTAIIVFVFFFALSRKIELRPGKAQNFLEWIVDFTNGIVKSFIPNRQEAEPFMLYAFVLFAFIFVSNQLGLIFEIAAGGQTFIKSPTSDPIVTMTLATITLVLSHFFSVQKYGFKKYLVNYTKPVGFLLPINILEEFTNFLTLALRLYGNIYSGEVLLDLIVKMSHSFGWVSFVGVMPISMVWQGFSVFIGAIQAYVFVTLSSVYISHKVVTE
ncbi:F0F1 ATP synthase subunit A [Lactobacillus sp. DCY120]|uniref:ATP synthase subunit a n=1 Tax=Bombilactobacillus apium TaxID=2675299 RepID=A0A850R472_9LACO|nr:F0F1 ATP synthase subunit A [Bombilactobacillus apium]NVY95637.1 F0F1 ATP synthase subunit A [Bombilactobacillus apium]